ncbi:GDSL esterase/lipase At5g03980-like [Pistacia vera]|uniref:GDSL esterase/lipase At5g03980-like n=1 Tax=Pistacia vera TaxID=55513 RepID=UPI001262CB2B|nr:GDSL esterase/lipase At5g03980-like [Pistacia vera]
MNGKTPEEVQIFIPSLQKIIGTLESELIKAGVSNILVPGMLPLGCFPGYVSLLHNVDPTDFDAHNCHIGLNNVAINYNNHVKESLSEMRDNRFYSHALSEEGDRPYSQTLYGDYYNAFMEVLRDNSNNPKALFHQDGFHLSEKTNKYIVGKLLSGNNFLQPEIHLPDITHCVM